MGSDQHCRGSCGGARKQGADASRKSTEARRVSYVAGFCASFCANFGAKLDAGSGAKLLRQMQFQCADAGGHIEPNLPLNRQRL
jgi:hypothetical protein